MRKFTALILSATSLCAGCATAPIGQNPPQVVAVCPRLPDLEEVDPAALARDYTGQMDRFLQGSLPTQPDYKLHSDPARTSTGGLKVRGTP